MEKELRDVTVSFLLLLFLSVFSLSLDSVGTASTVCKHILDFALTCLYHNFFLQKWPLFSFVHVITVQHRIDWERRTIIRIFSKHISCADYWSPTSPATAVSWIIPASFLYLMPLMRPAVRKAQFASLFACKKIFFFLLLFLMVVSNEAHCKITVLCAAVALFISSLNVLCKRSVWTSYVFIFIHFLGRQTRVS